VSCFKRQLISEVIFLVNQKKMTFAKKDFIFVIPYHWYKVSIFKSFIVFNF